MTEPERQAWEKVRAKGRDRFLLRSIGKMAWVFAIAGTLFELGFWLILKRPSQPLLAMIGTWIGAAFFVGAVSGLYEWARNEAEYNQGCPTR